MQLVSRARSALAALAVLALTLTASIVGATVPAAAVPVGPSVTVSKTSGLVDGEKVTVRGTGFVAGDPAAVGTRPPLAGKFAGTYVAFGRFAEAWEPSAGAPSTARVTGDTRWAVLAEDVSTIGGAAAGAIELGADGSFEAELTLTKTEKLLAATGRWGIYTYGGSGAKPAAFETFTPLTFAEPGTTPDPKPTPNPDPKPTGCVADPSITSAQVSWGVKSSFVTYISGPIAQGRIERTGVELKGGRFEWSGGTGTYADGKGSVRLPGALHFLGHHDEMNMRWTNLRLVLTSSTKAELRADADVKAYLSTPAQDLKDVAIASVDLSGAMATSGRTTTITNAAVTLLASGTPVFAGFYPAGEKLDPLSSTITVAEKCDDGKVPPTPTPVATPTVTLGGDVDGSRVEQGGTITFRVTGLPASATSSAEVHSDPISLGSQRTSAKGVVTYDFDVPEGFAAGRHTFVLSVAGVAKPIKQTFTVVRAEADKTEPVDSTGTPECVARSVTGATLTWGLKSSYLAYIEGSVAQGKITTSGAQRSGSTFTWSGGTGAYNTDAARGTGSFTGSVRTVGHGDVLDVTFSNPRVVLHSSTRASLVLDTRGTTIDGDTFAYAGITFATLSLSGHGGASGDRISYSGVPATLTAAGAKAFSGFYKAGDALAPVSFTLPLGGETDCSSPTGTLPVTGSEPVGLVALSGALLLAGAALVLVRRRRGAVPA